MKKSYKKQAIIKGLKRYWKEVHKLQRNLNINISEARKIIKKAKIILSRNEFKKLRKSKEIEYFYKDIYEGKYKKELKSKIMKRRWRRIKRLKNKLGLTVSDAEKIYDFLNKKKKRKKKKKEFALPPEAEPDIEPKSYIIDDIEDIDKITYG